jgi:hypothetical protein
MPYCKKTATAHFSTFGLARHTSRPFAKPKELKFSNRTGDTNEIKSIFDNSVQNNLSK